jgi:hypothetical protein
LVDKKLPLPKVFYSPRRKTISSELKIKLNDFEKTKGINE